jgi:hypothetical protein
VATTRPPVCSLALQIAKAYGAVVTAVDALTPAIHRTFSVADVPEALRDLQNGGERARVVITV